MLGISSKMGKDNMEPVKEDTFTLAKKIEHLEISKRKLLGDGLEPCSIDELNQLENQLERSLTRIRARKNQLFREQIEKLKGEDPNGRKHEAAGEGITIELVLGSFRSYTESSLDCGMQPLDLSSAKTPQGLQERQIVEVETELSIGPPKPQGLINSS
ncbi:MADS BOX PROTEIN [Salix purpurea]|uniref:MADS BOX PROTEIN n=1 Tax=Salix purpurea TaxID=77065 RepID=A0A9Q0TIP4_SALPP|nr:MADS BOX PROTEIN [Salix purpurea]